MSEIGGYFGIEYSNIELGIHTNATKLNTARNCLEYVLQANNFKHIYIPYYTCDVLLEPIIKQGIHYEFYNIDENFEPVWLPSLKQDQAFLYTNYFGIKGRYIKQLLQRIPRNLIVDNSQALFEKPLDDINTFYSLRKFVGTPDGAFLYCRQNLKGNFSRASSFNRVSHLYKRIDESAKAGFSDFKKNDQSLEGLPIMIMSPSTHQFVMAYDFAKNKTVRERNFLYLHSFLSEHNALKINVNDLTGPLCYPLLTSKSNLRDKFIARDIFVPLYWPNVEEWLVKNDNKGSFEKALLSCLVCLPIDQRYSISDLQSIVEIALNE